jgi:hypothetical protein
VASESSIRLWKVYRAAGRPWPVVCEDDDVIDYMVMEAVAIRAGKAEKAEQESKKREAWKEDKSSLEQYR